MYTIFIALLTIPVNVVSVIVMSIRAKYKWQAPLTTTLRLLHHNNMRLFFSRIGNAKKERQHEIDIEIIASSYIKENSLP